MSLVLHVVRKWGLAACLAGTCWAAGDLRLLDSVKRRDVKAFDTLLQQKADLDAAAPDGATALSWAIFLDQADMANKLIAAGAKVNTAGEYGETPLTLALANGNSGLTAKLLKAGADPKVTRWNGETALMIAAGAGCVESVQLLLDKGADVNEAEPKSQQNALMWAASEGHTDVVDLLLKKGAKVDAVSKAGFTPLIFASLKNDPHTVQKLLQASANPNYALPDGTKVLTIAASNKSYLAAVALLDGGADPNVADKQGNTTLHLAAQSGALDLVKELVAKHANLNPVTAPPPATRASAFRSMAGGQTPLLLAARANKVDVMKALVDAGADTKVKAQDGAGLLLAASASGRVDAARYAFQFDKDVKAADKNGLTAMHQAVGNPASGATQPEMTELVQFLADSGVPLDERDAKGRTPIQIGDIFPFDEPIQRMADLIVGRGGTPVVFPKEYKKPDAAKSK